MTQFILIFSGQSCLNGLQQLCPNVLQNLTPDMKYLSLVQVIKIWYLSNSQKNFGFPMVQENIYSSWTAINQPLPEGIGQGGQDV